MSRNQANDEVENTSDDATRVYNLNLELKRAKREKKQTTKMLSEEIKRIQAEIDEILTHENQPAATE